MRNIGPFFLIFKNLIVIIINLKILFNMLPNPKSTIVNHNELENEVRYNFFRLSGLNIWDNLYYFYMFSFFDLFSYIMKGISNIACMKNLHAILRYFSAGILRIQGGINAPFTAK